MLVRFPLQMWFKTPGILSDRRRRLGSIIWCVEVSDYYGDYGETWKSGRSKAAILQRKWKFKRGGWPGQCWATPLFISASKFGTSWQTRHAGHTYDLFSIDFPTCPCAIPKNNNHSIFPRTWRLHHKDTQAHIYVKYKIWCNIKVTLRYTRSGKYEGRIWIYFILWPLFSPAAVSVAKHATNYRF